MTDFPIYRVDSRSRNLTQNRKEPGGYLTKFWVDHPLQC